jgi:hypothetical protein
MFLTNGSTASAPARAPARALDTWHAAAQLVSTRWQVFFEAEPETRAREFASYLAALDAEEAAAAEMAGLPLTTVA